MFKKLMLLLFIAIPLFTSAQDMPFTVETSTRYSSSTMLGRVKVDSLQYTQIRLIQEFNYKKWGLGFDLDFLFDKDYRLKEDDWDDLQDALDKIYYFKYADTGDPFHFHVGGFPKYSVGNGLVMLNYSNMFYYPDMRYNGLLIGGKIPMALEPEIEFFTSDIVKNHVLSLQMHVKPLPDSTLKILDMAQLGLSIYTDRNQHANMKHILPASLHHLIPDDRDSATIIAFDYNQPLRRCETAEYGVYTEIAHLIGNGVGSILPGVYADFNFFKVNLEYRTSGAKFDTEYFDYYYEEERAIVDSLGGEPKLITKEERLQSRKSSYGIYGKLQGTIKDRVKLVFAWKNMYGKGIEDGKSLWFSMNVDTRYKRLERVAYSYSKTNVSKLRLGEVAVPRANMSASATIGLDSKRRWFVIGKYSEKYKDKEGGINWWKDTKRSVAVGVKYTF